MHRAAWGRSPTRRGPWPLRCRGFVAVWAVLAGWIVVSTPGRIGTPASAAEKGAAAEVLAPISPDYPNEPRGFEPIAEHAFEAWPLSESAERGEWENPSTENYRVVAVPTPSGDGRALRVSFPAGLVGGTSPGKFRFWQDLDVRRAPRYRRLYIAWFGRIGDRGFENHRVATKLFYFAYGNAAQSNDGGLTLANGRGVQAVQSQMQLRAFVSPADDRKAGSVNYHPNMRRAMSVKAGSWHLIEMLLFVGTPDRADGMLRVWIDRRLALNYTGVRYLSSDFGFTDGFFQMEWAPVWGGTGGVRTRGDHLDIDHIYVSGSP